VNTQPELTKAAPLPTAKEEWMAKYCLRLIERGGLDEASALACYEAGRDDHDYDGDPTEAADDEMSYWDYDGGGPTAQEICKP
jgi:hypothetical protein